MSTVLTFQLPSERWAYAVSPTRLVVGGGQLLNKDDALAAAKRVIEREGWEPLPPPSELPPPPPLSEATSFTGIVTIKKSATLQWEPPPLRFVEDES